ncbi:MAG: caspase family protein [Oscillatoriales cyanobacterium C42_A2020_001]|nr:caspase family protein [Leptolyngbyaceae cyanobacterium C42_A2020_001]
MLTIQRRQFLQLAGGTLAALGMSHLDLQQHSFKYGKVLAQGTPRKRALLIGINDYPGSDKRDLKTRGLWYQLQGAVNDVELQRELLIHRFGFHSDDILMLTNKKATRAAILNAFEKHLYDWVKSDDDVVVFHYSGHGSNVIDSNKIFSDGLNGTIVPFDAQLPDGYPFRGGAVEDITAGTIFLMREALGRKTKQVTFLLDSCYSGGGVRGNLVVRSRPGQFELRGEARKTNLEASPEEVEYQQRWLKQLQLSQEEWIARRKQNLVNGVAIFAAQRDQPAVDAAFASGVHAGVFTYSLVRQLWQQTSNQAMGKVIVAVAAKTEQFLKESRSQTPGFEARQSGDAQQLMYFMPMQNPPAEAVITEVKGQSVKLLLTGAEPQVLEVLGRGAVFTLVDRAGKPQGSVEIESRDRLRATGILKTNAAVTITPGTALQEQVRAIPPDLTLQIGLDPSLGEEETAAAAGLRSLPRIKVVPLLQQEAHYLLGRMQPDYHQQLAKQTQSDLPPVNSVGLFTVGLEPIPGSFEAAGETVTAAITRLQTKLRLLLAARLIKLTLNPQSSRINLIASLKPVDQQALFAQSFTVRGMTAQASAPSILASSARAAVAQVPINKPVQIVVENREAKRDLHMGVLIFSPDGAIDVLFPLSDGKDAAIVPAGQTLKFPTDAQIQDGAKLSFSKPLGLAELLIIASTAPITQALRPIQALADEKGNPQRSQTQVVDKAEAVVASLLDDLAGGTRSRTYSASVRKLNVQQMATLSITFEIVAQ